MTTYFEGRPVPSTLATWGGCLLIASLLSSACGGNDPTTLAPSPAGSPASSGGSVGDGGASAAGGAGSTMSSKGGSGASGAGKAGSGGSDDRGTGGSGDSDARGGSAGTSDDAGAANGGTQSGTSSSGGTSASGGMSASAGSSSSGGSGGSAGLDTLPGGGGGASSGTGGAPEPGFMVVFTDTASCATCHGDTGQGVATYGPEIRHPSRDLYLYMVRTGEPHQLAFYRKPMDPFDTSVVSDADLEDIFAWLTAMPKPTTGAELFADYCSYCHGADGRGGDKTKAYASAYHSAPYRRSGQDFLDYVRAGHVVDDQGMPVTVADRHAYMPPFPPETLTDQEIQLIEGWLPKQ